VRRLLEAILPSSRSCSPKKWFQELKPLLEGRPEEVRVYVADKPLLEALTGFSMYQGLLAVGKVPLQPTLEAILANSARPSPPGCSGRPFQR
jgi:hypothetical protein